NETESHPTPRFKSDRLLGLAFVSDFWVAKYLATGALQAALDDWTPPFPGLRLYYPRHRHMTAGLRAFIDLLQEESKAERKEALISTAGKKRKQLAAKTLAAGT
ncbi:MAG: LysR substrate-binding domain-containing protein, partial [Bradyrhizobium sp.]|uniref:LysR substrate-binding domain-containing protein n=1 Tax=Bradyrhizobium sp. TaxID=376 RepID=UPI0029A4F32E